jgi:threonine/homoserine/homoserine lactone efflux protein
MGFFTAIPIGATQIEIAKRSLHGQLRPAFMIVAGSVSSDVMYGFIAFFGVAPILRDQTVGTIFGLVGAVILGILAGFTLKQSRTPQVLEMNRSVLQSGHLSFITGFVLAVTNPIMVFWWLIGATIVKDLGLVKVFTPTVSLSFLCFGGLGLGSYLILLATGLYRARKFISDKFMQRINFSFGIVLVILALHFLIDSLKMLFK